MKHALLRSRSGFSTILAILLTGFLIVLSAGVLFLFLSESKINRTLFSITAAYHAAEGSMEYALLKVRNHREGFEDSVVFGNADSGILTAAFKKPEIAYGITARALGPNATYSGSIAAKGFEIVPLFFENGTVFHDSYKDPRKPAGGFDSYRQSENPSFSVVSDFPGTLVWNVVANDDAGNTYGLAGTLSGSLRSLGMASVGSVKTHNGSELESHTETLSEFLDPNRLPRLREPYLVVYNASESSGIDYVLTDDVGFSLPTLSVVASGRIGNITSNLRLYENKTRLFDALKYSVFVPE